MASSRRTYDTDVITLRTVFAKDVVNSNIPALRVLTADGAGGTYWAIPSSLGESPAFNQIITSAGTYTADLSYNRFRLLAGEGIGMVNGPAGSNQTTLYAQAFNTVDVSGDNSFYAFKNNNLTPFINFATTGPIQVRSDPATNTLFIDGPYEGISSGQFCFTQIKVIPETSTITSSVQGWSGDYITANTPSTLVRFAGVNDIQLSTNVTTNTVFFTISTFTSKGYLDTSTIAATAYPNAISTVSSLYTSLAAFNSTITSFSSFTGFGFSSVVSSIDALAMSTGEQFYILTGLINARATIIQLNSEIAQVNSNLASTVIGLGSAGYISTVTGNITDVNLISTVAGLGSSEYVSSLSLVSTTVALQTAGFISSLNLTSTVEGLGSTGYLSSLAGFVASTGFITASTVVLFDTETNDYNSVTVSGATLLLNGNFITGGPGAGGVARVLAGTNISLSPAGGTGNVTITNTGPTVLTIQSTVEGLGTAGYISTLSLTSTLDASLTSTTQGLQTEFGSLQLVSSTSLLSTVTGLGSAGYLSTIAGSLLLSSIQTLTLSSGQVYTSSLFTSSLVTQALTASTISQITIPPSSSNLLVAVGADATQNVKTSADGSTWTNAAGSQVFSTRGWGVAWNGQLWVAVGEDTSGSKTIQYSSDGSTWTTASGGGFLNTIGRGVAWNGQLWLAVGADAIQNIKYSTDGINWSNVPGTQVFDTLGTGIAWNGSLWLAVGQDTTQSVKYSTDGLNWSNASGANVFSIRGNGIAWNGRVWVAVGQDSTQNVKYSLNGINWSNASGAIVFLTAAFGIAWNGRMWIAVGDDATQNIKYSYNGIDWFNVPGAKVFSNNCRGITWNGSLWIATGSDATQNVKTSADGMIWTDAALPIVFATGGFGGAYSSNVVPSYRQESLEFEPQTIPVYLRSTNQVSFLQSTIILNNTLFVDTTNKVGINTGFPQADLDVGGAGRFLTVSTQAFFLSSLNGLNFTSILPSTVAGLGSAGYVSSASLVSTVAGLGSAPLISTVEGLGSSGYLSSVSTLITSSIFNTGAISTYSLEVFGSNTLTASGSTILRGATVLLGPVEFYGAVTSVGDTGLVTTPTLLSTLDGLGSVGYVSTASLTSTVAGISLNSGSLTSTVAGLGMAGYISTASLVSTVRGLGSIGYVSTASLVSTVAGIGLSTGTLFSTVTGLGSIGYVSTASLVSTVAGISLNAGSLTSTVAGLGTAGYISTASLTSTVAGLTLNAGSSIRVSTGILNASSISYVNIAPTPQTLIVAVGDDATQSNRIKYSYNGLTWSNSSGLGFSVRGWSVAWNGSMWVAVGEDATSNNTIKYSYDGITWSNSLGTGFSTQGRGVAWNGRLWVAVGDDTTFSGLGIKYSSDGITWSNATPKTIDSYAVAWNGRMWVVVGNEGSAATSIIYSYDGINWSNSVSGGFTNGIGIGVAWNGRIWVALGGASPDDIKYSTDGMNWSNATSGFSSQGRAVAWNGTVWVAVGIDATQNNTIKYSFDGINWSNSSGSGFTTAGYGISWNGIQWIAMGADSTANNTIKYSLDGVSWSNSSSGGFTTAGYGVAYSANLVPSYSQSNLQILPQAVPSFLRSTNQIFLQPSSMTLNNTLEIDAIVNRVGINTGTPQTDLDVAGTGRFQSLSTQQLNVSSINGLLFTSLFPSTVTGLGSAGYVSTASLTSTVRGLGTTGYISTASLTSTVRGLGSAGYVSSLVGVSLVSSVTVNAGTLNFTTGTGQALTIGTNAMLLSTNANNYPLQSLAGGNSRGFLWGAFNGWKPSGTGEGTNLSYNFYNDDRNISSGNRIINTGLNTSFLRVGNGTILFGTSTVNAIPQVRMTLDANGNFGIGRTPAQLLDVSGEGRFVGVSTQQLNASLIQAPVLSTLRLNTSSVQASVLSTQELSVSSIGFVNVEQTPVNRWVIVGNDSVAAGRIKYSSNGITWTNSEGATFTSTAFGVAWNGQLWVAVGTATTANNTIKYSYDGITWSNSSGSGFSTAGAGVAWNGRLWVAVGTDTTANNTIKYSYDGITWSNVAANGFTTSGASVAWNGSLWVAVGNDATLNNRIKYSYDGITWLNSASGAFNAAGYGVAWNGRLWVAVGNNSTVAIGSIKYSTDGINWFNNATGGFSTRGWAVAWNGRLWVAVGNNGAVANGSIQYSTDGINWTTTTGFTTTGYGISWNGTLWVAGGEDSTAAARIKYSYDGITWFNSSGGSTFSSAGWMSAYSYNTIPSYNQTNFEIQPQNIPVFLRSTNQISFLQSTLILNNTLFIDTTNRVGVNTGVPLFGLDVNGNARISSLVLADTAALSSISTFGPAASNIRFALVAGDAYKPTGTSWNVTSDQRIKENIVNADLTRCYDDVKQIQLRRFQYKSSFVEEAQVVDKRVLGFIAQEISSIIPKAITIGQGYGFDDLHMINTDQVNMSMYGAVKKLIHDKESLESTIQGQRVTIETLMGTQTFILSTLEGLQGR